MIFPGFFLHFQIFIFGINSGVKGQKMAQNYKKKIVLYSISREAYIKWLWFLVHMCKMMISPDAFFIFLKFWFSWLLLGVGVGGVKWQKMAHDDKKLCLSHSISQGMYVIWLCFLVHLCKMIYLAIFFHFSKFWFFGFLGGGVKGKKWPIITNFSLSHSVSQEL